MQMLDSLIDTLHGRYQGPVASATDTIICQWNRLIARLDDILDAVQDQGDETLRIFATASFNPGDQPILRTLRTGESVELETMTVNSGAGLVKIRRDGTTIYAKTFTAADTRPGEGLIIQGPGEITVEGAASGTAWCQFKFIAADTPKRRSRAGEQGIGVDPRENPGAADQGRHSLDAPTMIGHTTLSGE